MTRFVKRDAFSGKLSAPRTAGEAVSIQVDAETFSDGQLERHAEKITALCDIVGRLVDALAATGMRPDSIAEIIGCQWEAEK